MSNAQEPRLYPVKKGGKHGYINKQGDMVVPCIHEWTSDFSEGLGLIRTTSGGGYVDVRGDFVINPIYRNAGVFSSGLAVVRLPDTRQLACIKKDGSQAFEMPSIPSLHDMSMFLDGAAVYHLGSITFPPDRHGIINSKGQIVVGPHFGWAWGFSEGLCAVSLGSSMDETFFIDTEGKFVLNPAPPDQKVTLPGAFRDGLSCVQTGETFGTEYRYVTKEGIFAFDQAFDSGSWFSEGLAAVKSGGKWGFIDVQGDFKIPLTFESVGDFSEGLARFSDGQKRGFVNQNGDIVISPEFDTAVMGGYFKGGLAWVVQGETSGYINREGNFVWTTIT